MLRYCDMRFAYALAPCVDLLSFLLFLLFISSYTLRCFDDASGSLCVSQPAWRFWRWSPMTFIIATGFSPLHLLIWHYISRHLLVRNRLRHWFRVTPAISSVICHFEYGVVYFFIFLYSFDDYCAHIYSSLISTFPSIEWRFARLIVHY